MTVEETMNAIKITEASCYDNNAAWGLVGLGVLVLVFYLVQFIKDSRLSRPFCVVAMIGSAVWCAFGLYWKLAFPINVMIKVEVDPSVVSQSQLETYFNTKDLTWHDGKITCNLYPHSDVYDEVLEIIRKEMNDDV